MLNQNRNSSEKLSANFCSYEFDCHGNGCCQKTVIDEKLVTYCQKIRDHFAAPVTVNSGFRCEKHNTDVGGAEHSFHVKGMAADIAVKDAAPTAVAKYAETIGIKGIGLYPWGVHIDTRSEKSFWYGDAQEYRSTFGGKIEVGDIAEWQRAAQKDGFALPLYGADGRWGSESEKAAKSAVCKMKIGGWSNKNLTAFIQSFLGIETDGKFGPATKEAVIKYQQNHGLEADGIVGINTWKSILGVS